MITPEERHQIELAILGRTASAAVTALAPVIDAIMETRLREGSLPEGWKRVEEAEYSPCDGTWWNTSAAWVREHRAETDRPCRLRAVITSPWETR